MRGLPGSRPACERLHINSLQHSSRFGGRYMYSCSSGLTFFSSPIISGGKMIGGLVAGPVLLTDLDDTLDEIAEKRGLIGNDLYTLRDFLSSIPQVSPSMLRHLSAQLFASTLCISDSSREMTLRRLDTQQQQRIGEYIHEIKTLSQAPPYPIEKEEFLMTAMMRGDKASANALLNELLGHIFFFTSDPDTVRTRIAELLVLLSRASIQGGASVENTFQITHQYLQELLRMSSQEDMAQRLAQILSQFMDMIFELVDSKHKNIINKAVNYMTANCDKPIALTDVSEYVGYSSSHFSKVFKAELNCSFRSYLNKVRIEKSKILLLASNDSIAKICDSCGFEDQSYYCKIFKKVVGVTPDKFRKQSRRIDNAREYGH